MHRFELTHAPLPHSRRLVGQLTSIVGVLRCVVNRFWDKFSMSHVVASQFIRYDLSRFTSMFPQQPLKEPLCSLTITSLLKKYVHHFTILINRSPQVMLLTMDLHKNFIDEEGVAVSLMLSSQTLGVLRPELIAP